MVLKNRTYNHLGLLLEYFTQDLGFLFKIINPINEIYIGNGLFNLNEDWKPAFHIKATVNKKSLIVIKDLKKKNLLDYYIENDEVIIVLYFGIEYHSIFYHWLRGEYSLMLNKDQQKKLYTKKRERKFNAYNKIGNYSELFIEYIMKSFNLKEEDKHYINIENLTECDIAPLLKEETLNFNIELKNKIIKWHDNYKELLKLTMKDETV